ncbi:MAG: ribonuclease P protein component [Parcubacteria group bacterium]|jgi:ribonuclease P protein component
MITKPHRLHTYRFSSLYSQGKRHYFGGALLFFLPNNSPHSHIAYVVGKKYSPSAVKRNRQRRVLYAALHTHLLNLAPGYDIVISYTNRGKVLPYREACATLSALFSQAKLI